MEDVATYRELRIFDPFPDEMPRDLVGAPEADEIVRVAKREGRVVGAYRLARLEGERFEIRALAVDCAHRRRGVGRWLLRHAIGVAENRGGRLIDAPRDPVEFFRDSGFALEDGVLRLRPTPE